MQNRRSFLKAGLAAACACLHGPRQAAGHRRAAGIVAGQLGRVPLIELRVNRDTVYFCGRSIHALHLGLGIIRSTIGLEDAKRMPRRISAIEYKPDVLAVSYDYGDMLLNLELGGLETDCDVAEFRAVCYGTEGTLSLAEDRWTIHWNNGTTEAGDEPAIRIANAELTPVSSELRRLAGISFRLGREIRFEPITAGFPDDANASPLLS